MTDCLIPRENKVLTGRLSDLDSRVQKKKCANMILGTTKIVISTFTIIYCTQLSESERRPVRTLFSLGINQEESRINQESP